MVAWPFLRASRCWPCSFGFLTILPQSIWKRNRLGASGGRESPRTDAGVSDGKVPNAILRRRGAAHEPAGFSRVAQARRRRGARSASLRLAVAQCFQPASAVAAGTRRTAMRAPQPRWGKRDACDTAGADACATGLRGYGAGLARPLRHWGWASGQRPPTRFIPHHKSRPWVRPLSIPGSEFRDSGGRWLVCRLGQGFAGIGGGVAAGLGLPILWKNPPLLKFCQPQRSQRRSAAASQSAQTSMASRYHQIEMERHPG